MSPPPRPEPQVVLEGSISKVMQDLDEMRLKEQKIEEEIEQLMQKRLTTEGEKERVALRLEKLHEKSKWLHEEKMVLQQLRLQLHGQ